MATSCEEGCLTQRQIVRLAAAISADNMAAIAEGYMDISNETVKNKRSENRDNAEAFNREVIRYWVNTNSAIDHVQNLASLLYQSAAECGCVDPNKVEEILGVSCHQEPCAKRAKMDEETVTEVEWFKFTDELKAYTGKAMKIDAAPWMQSSTEVDMDKLYIDLELEKLENGATSIINRKIQDYNQIFDEECTNNTGQEKTAAKQTKFRRRKGKKILLKGGPGMGKTTLMKKIGWDWAKGIFNTFSVVFFVLLKLVKPGEAIENIIISQRSELKGMGMTPPKLLNFLGKFGNKCLIILDGLDEYALGKNRDVLEIIKGEKLLYCNVVVTSRPHSGAEVEGYVSTIVRVNGFTRSQAEKFARQILDEKEVEIVMNFNPFGYGRWRPSSVYFYSCPILLSILCVLLRNQEVDLSDELLSKGEVYLKLVKFLYKKYIVSKDIRFDQKMFEDVLKGLGKLAWEMLQSGNPFLVRSEVLDQVGEDAFVYGLLIGHEDIRLISKVDADILVTFTHRTFQDFLGSLHLIVRLGEGNDIGTLLGNDRARLTSDPLFLQFCLWFINQNKIPLPNKEKAQNALKTYISAQMNMIQVDLEAMGFVLQSFNFNPQVGTNDQQLVTFSKDIIRDLSAVKCLWLKIDSNIYDPVADYIGPNVQSLSRIIIQDGDLAFGMTKLCPSDELSRSKVGRMTWLQFINHMHCDGDFDIVLAGTACNPTIARQIQNKVKESGRKISMYLFPSMTQKIDLSSFLDENVKKFFIHNLCPVICHAPIIPCPHLTHLFLIGVYKATEIFGFDSTVFVALSVAVAKGNLPNLSHLSFEDCRFGICGHLHLLFQCIWPSLTELNFEECLFDLSDFAALSSAHEKGFFPQLESISVGDLYKWNKSGIHTLLKNLWAKITMFSLTNIAVFNNQKLSELSLHDTKSSKRDLSIHLGPDQQPDDGLRMILETAPNLESLAMKEFFWDLGKLVGTVTQCRLKKLDITYCAGLAGNLRKFLHERFLILQTLILSHCGLNSEDLLGLAEAFVEGRLPELKHLDISKNPQCGGYLESLFQFSCTWDNLLTLNAQQHYIKTECEQKEIFSRDVEVLFRQVEAGCLRNIEEISFTAYYADYPSNNQRAVWKHVKAMNILAAPSDFPEGKTSRIVTKDNNILTKSNILKPVITMVGKGMLPSLEILSVVVPEIPPHKVDVAGDKYVSAKANICVYISGTCKEEYLES